MGATVWIQLVTHELSGIVLIGVDLDAEAGLAPEGVKKRRLWIRLLIGL